MASGCMDNDLLLHQNGEVSGKCEAGSCRTDSEAPNLGILRYVVAQQRVVNPALLGTPSKTGLAL